jgi:hypothetical protein
MKNPEIEKLEAQLVQAESEVQSAEMIWVSAKRNYYKTWVREYEFADDENRDKDSLRR